MRAKQLINNFNIDFFFKLFLSWPNKLVENPPLSSFSHNSKHRFHSTSPGKFLTGHSHLIRKSYCSFVYTSSLLIFLIDMMQIITITDIRKKLFIVGSFILMVGRVVKCRFLTFKIF